MIEIRNMTVDDVYEVSEIEKATFYIPWTEADFKKEMTENKLAIYKVAVLDGKIVGYCGMWHVVTEGHITNVAVLEDYRGKGIGDMLISSLIDEGIKKEMIGITLEVRISNIKAQRLYSKYGFKPEGFRKKYYSDTGEDAVIMWKYFPINQD